MKEKKKKIIFEERIKCPHCNKKIKVRKTKKIIEEAVKAEYEEQLIVEKDAQTSLK